MRSGHGLIRGAIAAIPVIAVVIFSLAACSSRQVYQSAQGWRQQQCERAPDKAERDRCIEAAAGSYDEYRRAVERTR